MDFIVQGLFLFYSLYMKTPLETNYINRLMDCGYSCICAYELYKCFKAQDATMEELDHFVILLERDIRNVDKVQS